MNDYDTYSGWLQCCLKRHVAQILSTRWFVAIYFFIRYLPSKLRCCTAQIDKQQHALLRTSELPLPLTESVVGLDNLISPQIKHDRHGTLEMLQLLDLLPVLP